MTLAPLNAHSSKNVDVKSRDIDRFNLDKK